jgi:hypothetical protein
MTAEPLSSVDVAEHLVTVEEDRYRLAADEVIAQVWRGQTAVGLVKPADREVEHPTVGRPQAETVDLGCVGSIGRDDNPGFLRGRRG